MLEFVAGLLVGGVVGIITMCLMTAAKAADAHIEDCEYTTVMEGRSEAVAPTFYQEQSADESERRQ